MALKECFIKNVRRGHQLLWVILARWDNGDITYVETYSRYATAKRGLRYHLSSSPDRWPYIKVGSLSWFRAFGDWYPK